MRTFTQIKTIKYLYKIKKMKDHIISIILLEKQFNLVNIFKNLKEKIIWNQAKGVKYRSISLEE